MEGATINGGRAKQRPYISGSPIMGVREPLQTHGKKPAPLSGYGLSALLLGRAD